MPGQILSLNLDTLNDVQLDYYNINVVSVLIFTFMCYKLRELSSFY